MLHGRVDDSERENMTTVYYTQVKNGKLYPKQRQKGVRLVFANDVYRKGNKVVTKYIGIVEAPKDAEIERREKP